MIGKRGECLLALPKPAVALTFVIGSIDNLEW